MGYPRNMNELRNSIVGIDTRVPVLGGREEIFVNFDNAASTPTFIQVRDKTNDFLNWYSNVHRGMGFKSQLSSKVFDDAREEIGKFIGADPDKDVVIFGKNTTEVVNILSHRLGLGRDDIVLTSIMEHHSNDLPWRSVAQVIHLPADKEGNIDYDAYLDILKKSDGKVKVVALSGASNVTGVITDIHRFAGDAHRYGAIIAVDAAQLVPHRPVDMLPHDDEGHIDFVTFSAHKVYAPFGIGVLAGRRDCLKDSAPFLRGGGTVKIVTEDKIAWDDTPERDEAGTPVIVGVLAFVEAIRVLDAVGWDTIIKHEAELTSYMLGKMNALDDVDIYGLQHDASPEKRMGVIPFNIRDKHHAFTAAVLGYEAGVGVRNGCFCAHPFLLYLMDVKNDHAECVRKEIIAGDRSNIPGIVRASFGCYNEKSEVDRFISALEMIIDGKQSGEYKIEKSRGEYYPINYTYPFDKYFSL